MRTVEPERQREQGMFANWLIALARETLPAAIAALSLASTVVTFIPGVGFGRLRLISVIALLVGFGWANFLVYRKQRQKIGSIEQELDGFRERRACLIIRIENAHYLLPASSPSSSSFAGLFVSLHVMLENQGSVPSVINEFRLQIQGLEPITDLVVKSGIQGRRSLLAVDPRSQLAPERFVRLGAGDAKKGSLIFYSRTAPPALAHSLSDPGNQTYPPLVCKLEIKDTQGVVANVDFEANET